MLYIEPNCSLCKLWPDSGAICCIELAACVNCSQTVEPRCIELVACVNCSQTVELHYCIEPVVCVKCSQTVEPCCIIIKLYRACS